MVRKYKPTAGARRKFFKYSEEDLKKALEARNEGQTYRDIETKFGIPKATLMRKMKGMHSGRIGKPTVFSSEEEDTIVSAILTCAEWRYPLDINDVKFLAKGFLDRNGKAIDCFKNNLPGSEWARLFLKRNKARMSQRIANNLTPYRAKLTAEVLDSFFDHLEVNLDGVPASNVFNYDETALVDDPGKKKMLFRRGTKFPDRTVHHSKSSISVMWCGSANGVILPPFVVYKAEGMYPGWITGGPVGLPFCKDRNCCKTGTHFGCSKNGWFLTVNFEEFFFNTFLPHAQQLPGQKVLIGDNLSTHFSAAVIQSCEEHQICFLCLPPNSTHLLQPLDYAFFASMKRHWRQLLSKHRCTSKQPLTKTQFPSMLSKMVKKFDNMGQVLKNSFEGTGIFPVDRLKSKNKLPGGSIGPEKHQFLIDSVAAILAEKGSFPEVDAARARGKRIRVEPGKSLCTRDLSQESSTSDDEIEDPDGPGPSSRPTAHRLSTSSSDSHKENDNNDEADNLGQEQQTFEHVVPTCLSDLIPGVWVALFYQSTSSKHSSKWYLSKLECITKRGLCKTKSLERVEPNNYKLWKWPIRADVGEFTFQEILCSLKTPPKLATKKGIDFELLDDIGDEIQDLFMEKLKGLEKDR